MSSRLSVYRFGADRQYEGDLLLAFERMENAATRKALDALFVAVDASSGELEAIDLSIGRADGTLSGLLDFRMDPAARKEATRRTLAPHRGAVAAAIIEELGHALAPGGALLAVLTAGEMPVELEEAATRSGGRLVAAERVGATQLADLVPQLRAVL